MALPSEAPMSSTQNITTLTLSALPPTHSLIHTAHIPSLPSSSLQALLADPSPLLNAGIALIDARMLPGARVLLAACTRAAGDLLAGRGRVKGGGDGGGGEIVFALGGSSNIASTLRTFGPSQSTRSLVAVRLGSAVEDAPAEARQQRQQEQADELLARLHGVFGEDVRVTGLDVAALRAGADVPAIRKAYKLTTPGSASGGGGGKGRKGGKRKVEEEGMHGVEVEGMSEGAAMEEVLDELEVHIMAMIALRGS